MKYLANDWSSNLELSRDNHLNGFFSRVVFVKVTDKEISFFKENGVPKSKKGMKKLGLKLFRGKKYVVECCLTLFCVKHCVI